MKKKIQLVPEYSVFPLMFVAVWNQVVYNGAMVITRTWPHYNWEFAIDKKIPFLPWTVSIYFACYFFWIANYIICARQDKTLAYRFLGADILAKTVCLVCFLLFPTTNIRPEILGHTIWDELMRFLYQVDPASNLFPSIHCLVSWLCFIGVRGKKYVPGWYQCFSCLMAVAVLVSTLTTKQHVMVDVVGGVVLAEGCYWVMGRFFGKCCI